VAEGLRRTLYVLSVIPILAGASTVVLGADSVLGAGEASPSLESELRFYSVWWIGAGLFLIWLAPRIEERTLETRVFCALLFLAGLSRVFAALATDWPSTGQMILMVIEFVLPIVLVAWQARVKRACIAAERA
jgi:Domain of unknown function (DUF4345)